jgi:trimethylamine-N-oxide reductase (cytochrome c)
MIWTDTPCLVTCWNDGNSILKAYRHPKIEFILAQHPWLENDCTFADIILPSNTKFETEDIGVDIFSGQFDAIFPEPKCIEPRGESKSDYEVVCTIAEKLGLLEEYTGGKSVEEWIKHGYETSGVADHISYEELKEKGYWIVPTDPNWRTHTPGMRDFATDPEKHPLNTPSGKIEFYSERLAKHFPDDKERPPVPHWVPYGESHQESLSHPRAEKYPFLVCSNHPKWRVHAQHDDMTWLREIPTCKVKGPDGYFYEPLWIHPSDANKRTIRNGDVVMIFNERGTVLAGARLTERIMPGTVYIDHGARYDPILPAEIDRGGAINTICPHHVTSKHATGQVASGFLVEVQKADIEDLMRKYPEVFKKPYDQAAGLCMERVLVRDKKE